MKALARFGYGRWMLTAALLFASFNIRITITSLELPLTEALGGLGGK